MYKSQGTLGRLTLKIRSYFMWMKKIIILKNLEGFWSSKKGIKLNQRLKKSLLENLVHGTHFINLLLYLRKKSKFSFIQNSFYKDPSVQSLRLIWLFVTPWTSACQASLSITNSRSLFRLISIESVMPSNHLILCLHLLHPSIFPIISVFSSESVLCIRWLKYWSFSFSISPSNEYSGLISFRMDWLDLLAV